jgi:Fe-S-cluster-containing dehydrogenase component
VQACPYGCRYILPDKGVVDKCTLCYHRITKGLNPACVEVCPTGARMYGNLHDPADPLVKFIKDHNVRVLKPHLNTGSKLYYNELNEEVR